MVKLASSLLVSGALHVDMPSAGCSWIVVDAAGLSRLGAGRDAGDRRGYLVPGELPARRRAAWHFSGTESLAEQRLGVINDYSYGDELNTYIALHHGDSERIQIAAGDTALALNIGKLMHGRVDVVLENAWVMQAMLASQGQAGGLREAGCRAPDVPIYLAFSPALESSPRYVALFDQGVQRYRANGRLQQLLQAYGVGTP